MTAESGWFFWAALSAVFAALTAIFAKIGIQGVDSDLATLVRTVIIVFVLAAFVWFAGKWSNPLALSGRTWLFLALSALATGASWVWLFPSPPTRQCLTGGSSRQVQSGPCCHLRLRLPR
jgi:transporter family protein